ncbi:MAG: chemotaxis response regulator protein-glutamate methylesterase [Actinobacteria bacterium]|nr:chemotaxis response regulator protein-glutamate methylesterase [Actinomycetota bacterium]
MTPTPGRIRVLVVDDSAVIRKIVTEALGADPTIEIVGIANNGQEAVAKVEALKPDAVTMDIEMPVMNGIEAVRAIRRSQSRLPIVMFSTLTERGASATLDALAAGASDYVTKPSNVGNFAESQKNIREQLIPKLKALTGTRRAVAGAAGAKAPAPARAAIPPAQRRPRTGPFGVLAIGSSTGGPDALAQVLPLLPASLPVPVVVVQHMPPLFTRLLAQRLDVTCKLTVVEASEGELIVPGKIVIAPGGKHLVIKRSGTSVVGHLTEDPPENFCRPAVDVLFRSVAAVYGDRVLACVLTGMGRDGEKGAGVIRAGGGEVYAQDEATSVVWGMPGAVATAGQADKILPLQRIGPDIATALSRGPAPVGVGS